MLEAKSIVKILGEGAAQVQALKGVNLDLMPGELTLLMGPSGSGKTTLLSILGCILSPNSGTLTIARHTATGMSRRAACRSAPPARGLRVPVLQPGADADRHREHHARARPARAPPSQAPALAAEALRQVGLSHRANATPSKLSGGEKQRVSIARALAGSPSVILADEPTAALDSENGKGVMALLSQVAKDASRAVLVVTHDHRTLSYADRLIRIEDGRIVGRARKRVSPKSPSPESPCSRLISRHGAAPRKPPRNCGVTILEPRKRHIAGALFDQGRGFRVQLEEAKMTKRLKHMLQVAVFAGVAAGAGPAFAADPTGIWYDHTGRGAVEIVKCGSNLCGKLVWLKNASHKEGCGLQILGDVKPVSTGVWMAAGSSIPRRTSRPNTASS